MKQEFIDIYLIVLLVALLYFKPQFLTDISQAPLGKLILIVGVIYLAHNHGISTGLLGSFIFILLIHNNILEGVDETLEDPAKDIPKEDPSQIDTEEGNEEEINQETKQDSSPEVNDKKYQKNDLLDNEEMLKSDVLDPSSEITQIGKKTSEIANLESKEPEGVAMDTPTQEGFMNLY